MRRWEKEKKRVCERKMEREGERGNTPWHFIETEGDVSDTPKL